MAASKHIYTYIRYNTLPQCSPPSVGLTQARPNKKLGFGTYHLNVQL